MKAKELGKKAEQTTFLKDKGTFLLLLATLIVSFEYFPNHISSLFSKKQLIAVGKQKLGKFSEKVSKEKPLRIVIPRLNINIPVVEAPVINGNWKVSDSVANHGQGSAYPGQEGNMVIFAHARRNMFINLRDVTTNDDIYVLTNKKWYVYKVSDIREATPEQVELIAPTNDERITLFTCKGFSDEKRLIVVGKPCCFSGLTQIGKIW